MKKIKNIIENNEISKNKDEKINSENITKDIEVKDNKIKEEENKDNENLKYNPDDDKYEIFDVCSLKEESKFEIKNNIKMLVVLQDKRILTYQQCKKGEDGYDL